MRVYFGALKLHCLCTVGSVLCNSYLFLALTSQGFKSHTRCGPWYFIVVIAENCG